MENIELFFKKYAEASSTGDAYKVAGFYTENFMVATKNESKAFANDRKFIEWLNGVFAFNKKVGLLKMNVSNVDSVAIGEYYIKATVTWGAVFAKKPEEEIVFDIHYILNRIGRNFKIVLYISEDDQEELMKKEGLM